jgi:4-aminobutyrate aminotransferase-like enzyme
LWGLELGGKNRESGGKLAGHLVTRGLASGLIVLGGGAGRNVLSITPSFAMTESEIAWVAAKLDDLLEKAPQE